MKCYQCKTPIKNGEVLDGRPFCGKDCYQLFARRMARKARYAEKQTLYANERWASPPAGFMKLNRDDNEPLLLDFLKLNGVPYQLYDAKASGAGVPNIKVAPFDLKVDGHWVEVKNPKNPYLTPAQKEWIEIASDYGIKVHIVTCVEEMADLLYHWGYRPLKHLDYSQYPKEWVYARYTSVS